MPPEALALYLHFPFCARKCAYCDFTSHVPTPGEAVRYLSALRLEIARAAVGTAACPIPSVYFGGGTPTLYPVSDLAGVIDLIRASYALDPSAEITCEANPGTVDEAYLRALREAGVNRLSLGVQSFDEAELRLLGRLHDAAAARAAVRAARAAGFTNLSLDLIAGLPGQSPAAWRRNLDAALALEPEHLSCYGLSIPPGTALARCVASGEVSPLGESVAAEIWELNVTCLAGAGCEHYEISNYARPGFRCRHNLTYWQGGDYLGLGVSAASYRAGRRWTNLADTEAYVQCLEAGGSPALPGESLPPRERLGERLMLALRLADGADLPALRGEFGAPALAALEPTARQMAAAGLLLCEPDRWRPTRLGMLLNNQLALAFLAASAT